MKRRAFLNLGIPLTGAALVPGVMHRSLMEEINYQFDNSEQITEYDLIVNGAGLQGCLVAIEAKKKGKNVLVVDRHAFPGFDIAAKKKLWIKNAGYDKIDDATKSIFFPKGEAPEIRSEIGSGENRSIFDNDHLLFAGSVRKTLLKTLLENKVHVLLMTDLCGIFSKTNKVTGVLLAGKHGMHHVPCQNVVDCSEQASFTRQLLNDKYVIKEACFILELTNVARESFSAKINVPGSFEDVNSISLRPGKKEEGQAFLEFTFIPTSQDRVEIENQARQITADLGKKLKDLTPGFAEAQIYQLATETTIVLEDDKSLAPPIAGHYMLPASSGDISFEHISRMQTEASQWIKELHSAKSEKRSAQTLHIVGADIAASKCRFTEIVEPGLIIPLEGCAFPSELIPDTEDCQVLVAGGGTAGAMSAIGAAEMGVNTMVCDYFYDLGGTKTMGGVMGYYHGVKDQKFFQQHVEAAEGFAIEHHMTKKMGRVLYLLKELKKQDARFYGGAIICGAITNQRSVGGVKICRDGKLTRLQGDLTIDGTGDGDVAAFAGATFDIGDDRYGLTQNYSQWDIASTEGIEPRNRDYDIIDNTKISELQRGLFLSHYEAHYYDFHPMLTVRESRRIHGLYELNLNDAVEGTYFHDTIAFASSDFDPHNVGTTPMSRCGFLLPHSNVLKVAIPYRSIVPRELDGLLMTGRGFCQTYEAFQFTRMTADLIVLGYLTGQMAADMIWKGRSPVEYDMKPIQKSWINLGYLPAFEDKDTTITTEYSEEEVLSRVTGLVMGKQEYLYECVRLPKESALPILQSSYDKNAGNKTAQLLQAKALAWFGDQRGTDIIEEDLKALFLEESKTGYPGGYVDDYDSIRGRELNVLEGHFWKINQNIGLLGMAKDTSARDTVNKILLDTTSGGDLIERTNAYFNGRIDLRFIPFYNRIFNLCFYIERVPDPLFVEGLEKLLQEDRIGDFMTTEYDKVRWRVYGSILELVIASSLARCGSRKGYQILGSYLNDIHYMLKKYASNELRNLTGKNYKYSTEDWKEYITGLSYPRSTVGLS